MRWKLRNLRYKQSAKKKFENSGHFNLQQLNWASLEFPGFATSPIMYFSVSLQHYKISKQIAKLIFRLSNVEFDLYKVVIFKLTFQVNRHHFCIFILYRRIDKVSLLNSKLRDTTVMRAVHFWKQTVSSEQWVKGCSVNKDTKRCKLKTIKR